jgi:hypothetical protein
MTRATVDGLRRLVRPEDVAELRGKRIVDVLPVPRAGTRETEEEQEEPTSTPETETETETTEETK